MDELVGEQSFLSTYRYPTFGRKALKKYGDWLPVRSSSELAEIIASLITDGHLEGRIIDNHWKYDYIGYFSKNVEDLEYFNSLLEKVFGIKGKIRSWGKRINGRSTGVILCKAPLSRILMICGTPVGDKVSREYKIPKWIIDGSDEIKRAFLRRAFSCEGSVCKKNLKGAWEIKYSMGKVEKYLPNGIKFLENMRKMLLGLGIETTPIRINERKLRKKDGQITIILKYSILKRSFYLFQDKIGFDIGYKNTRLQKAIEWASTNRDL